MSGSDIVRESETMKRILSAFWEQTLRFETEGDYQTYVKGLQRKRMAYQIVDRQSSGNAIIVKVVREYNSYPTGNYLKS